MPDASVKKEPFMFDTDVWKVEIHKNKMSMLPKGSPEHELLKQQLDLMSSFYSPRVRDFLIKITY